MTKKRGILLSVAALVVLVGGLVAGSLVARQVQSPPRVEKPAIDGRLAIGETLPDIAFLATYGDTVQLRDLIGGRNAVLIFLSTTCNPCGDLAAEWRDVFLDYGDTYELVGVSSEAAVAVESFVAKWGLPFPILIDADRRFASEYHIEASPTFLGIDPNGSIAFSEIGYEEGQADTIRELLKRF